MSTKIKTYTLDFINELNKTFKAVLDKSIITKLLEIKNNVTFCKYVNPIEITYKVDGGRGNSNIGNISNPNIVITPEVISSRIVSNLNKLTIRNYSNILKIVNKIIDEGLEEKINSTLFVDIIFNKAVEEMMYSNLYAKLANDIIQASENKVLLQDYLVLTCQDFYKANIKNNIDNIESDISYDTMCNINKDKTLLLGGIAFICNLFNYQLIDYDFVHTYYTALGDIIEGDIENINVYVDTLGSIINTCGEKLYLHNKDVFHENYIKIIESLSKDNARLKSKYRFKLLDILDTCKKFTV